MPDQTLAFHIVETDIPGRLDRLPWSAFHLLVVATLGITWVLDGLEVTLAGSVASGIENPASLGLTAGEIGLAASSYLAGAVLGALFFGWLTDRLGRKKLFTITLAVYLVATALTAFSWDAFSFALFRFATGAGIGGEYAAINSAIQEFIPARLRGRLDLIVNGSFWVGAAIGAGASLVLLDAQHFAPDLGWRIAFFIGACLGLVILLMRRTVPESPRWLMTHGRVAEAEAIVAEIEARVRRSTHADLGPPCGRIKVRGIGHVPLSLFVRTLARTYPTRFVLGLVLMAAQAFLYNAIFFTYALVLERYYRVPGDQVGWYLLPFAAANFLGAALLGRLFDTVGRKPMIAGTYAASGVMLALTAVLFGAGLLDATTQTIAWMAIFFTASAAASAAYLTVGESFPLELRALAIAVFYALGTALGGIIGPTLFSRLIEAGGVMPLMAGYLVAALLMLESALVELAIGIAAERRPLEEVARPLSEVGG
jgi:MFS family permease